VVLIFSSRTHENAALVEIIAGGSPNVYIVHLVAVFIAHSSVEHEAVGYKIARMKIYAKLKLFAGAV